jgi:hypothetical protein
MLIAAIFIALSFDVLKIATSEEKQQKFDAVKSDRSVTYGSAGSPESVPLVRSEQIGM